MRSFARANSFDEANEEVRNARRSLGQFGHLEGNSLDKFVNHPFEMIETILNIKPRLVERSDFYTCLLTERVSTSYPHSFREDLSDDEKRRAALDCWRRPTGELIESDDDVVLLAFAGIKFHESGADHESISLLERAVSSWTAPKPPNVIDVRNELKIQEALTTLGMAYAATGGMDSAIVAWRQVCCRTLQVRSAAELIGKDDDALSNAYRSALSKWLTRSRNLLQENRALCPSSAQLEEAESHLRQAWTLVTAADELNVRANTGRCKGGALGLALAEINEKSDSALQELKRVDSLAPHFETAVRMNDVELAIGADYVRAFATYLKSCCAYLRRNFDQALDFVTVALELCQDPPFYCLQATVLRELGRTRSAVGAFKRALALNPDEETSAEIRRELASIGEHLEIP